jgi:hypothetical protein
MDTSSLSLGVTYKKGSGLGCNLQHEARMGISSLPLSINFASASALKLFLHQHIIKATFLVRVGFISTKPDVEHLDDTVIHCSISVDQPLLLQLHY